LLSKEETTKLLKVEQTLEDYRNYIRKSSVEIIGVGQKMQNHVEKNFHLGNKKALYYNLKQYCEET
jgi:tubulin polyglutamylase TTLL1/tubulin monoglycylase TTLL3/8